MILEKNLTQIKLLDNKDVLLIGVDEIDQMLLKYIVEEQGGVLATENSTNKALEKIRDRNYDLLIINTRLERLNTLDLVKNMRSNKEIRVPVIGITSHNLQGRALHSGFDYVIKRPIEKSKVHFALEAVLNR